MYQASLGHLIHLLRIQIRILRIIFTILVNARFLNYVLQIKCKRYVYKVKRISDLQTNLFHSSDAALLGFCTTLTMDSSVYRSALFFVAVFLVNIHTSQCLLKNLLGGRPSSTTVTNKREQSKPIQTRDPLGNVESLTGDLTNGRYFPI